MAIARGAYSVIFCWVQRVAYLSASKQLTNRSFQGHEKRRTVYNLYHILNHDVLFGGMYLNQARGMISQIMNY